jgi:hypothetical protein
MPLARRRGRRGGRLDAPRGLSDARAVRSLVRSFYLIGALVSCASVPDASAPEARRGESEPPQRASTPDQGDEGAAAIVCEAYCSRVGECGRQGCACPAIGRRLGLLKRGYLGMLALCLDGVACSAIEGERAWGGCHDFVVNGIEPTRPLRTFCFESSRRAARCGRAEEADQSACLVAYRHISDEAVEQAIACLARDCPEVPGCVAEWLRP